MSAGLVELQDTKDASSLPSSPRRPLVRGEARIEGERVAFATLAAAPGSEGAVEPPSATVAPPVPVSEASCAAFCGSTMPDLRRKSAKLPWPGFFRNASSACWACWSLSSPRETAFDPSCVASSPSGCWRRSSWR